MRTIKIPVISPAQMRGDFFMIAYYTPEPVNAGDHILIDYEGSVTKVRVMMSEVIVSKGLSEWFSHLTAGMPLAAYLTRLSEYYLRTEHRPIESLMLHYQLVKKVSGVISQQSLF